MALDLWQIRRQKRMTIDELARRAEIHPGLIKAYELGERAVSASDLERLAEALEVDPSDIKELSEPPPRGPSRQNQPPQAADPSHVNTQSAVPGFHMATPGSTGTLYSESASGYARHQRHNHIRIEAN